MNPSPRTGDTRLGKAVHSLERASALDGPAGWYDAVAKPLASGPAGGLLRGTWLGHALHPFLTDVPLGCWLGAGLLDLFGRKESRVAAQKLVGAGLLAGVPTALAGAAEWPGLFDRSTRRVAVAHASGNVVVMGLYFASWRLRRDGNHWRGVAAGIAGGTLAWVTAYLGGHLSFGRSVGHGERWPTEHSSEPDS